MVLVELTVVTERPASLKPSALGSISSGSAYRSCVPEGTKADVKLGDV